MTDSAVGEAKSGAHAVWESGETLIDVLIEYLVPFVALIIGFFLGPVISPSGAFWNVLTNANIPGLSNQGALNPICLISDGITAGIWGVVAFAMWHVRSRISGIWKAIPGFVAGLFGGMAGSELLSAFQGVTKSGTLTTLLSSWVSSVNSAAQNSGSATGGS